MKLTILCFTALLAVSVPAYAQQPLPGKDGEIARTDLTITGCLSKNEHNEYELVDVEGVHNLPYSATVDLDNYVGKTVTLVGRRAASPSAETTAGPVKTHFMVKKVESASGQCKK